MHAPEHRRDGDRQPSAGWTQQRGSRDFGCRQNHGLWSSLGPVWLFFVHVDGTVESVGWSVGGQAPPSVIGPLNQQVPPGPCGTKHPGLGCWALAQPICWGPVMRMSEPYLADVVARITYAFCFPFSMSSAPMFTYVNLLCLRLPFLI